MARFCVSAACVIIVTGLLSVDASCQHMICKAVDDECSDEDAPQSYSRTRVIRGPAGKLGPKGDKGDIGGPGRPGTVNRNYLKDLVDQEVNGAATDLRQLIARLQRQVDSLGTSDAEIRRGQTESNRAIGNLRQQIRNLQRQVRVLNETTEKIKGSDQGDDKKKGPSNQCGGITYRSKCYFAAVRSSTGVVFSAAKRMCIEQGAKLADIVNLEHENMVQSLIRNNMKGTSIQVWLGMTISVSSRQMGPDPWMRQFVGIVQLGTGSSEEATRYRWYGSSQPSFNRAFTNILLEASATSGGLLNRTPTHSGSRGALCMK